MEKYPLKKKLKESVNPVLRNRQLAVRLNPAEYDFLSDHAKKSNKTLHEYVREVAISYSDGEQNFRDLATAMENLILLFDRKLEKIISLLKKKETKSTGIDQEDLSEFLNSTKKVISELVKQNVAHNMK
jgi:hypothetical protein